MMIKEMISTKDMLEVFPLMRQLRTHLSQEAFIRIARDAKDKEGYKIFALHDEGPIISGVCFNNREFHSLFFGVIFGVILCFLSVISLALSVMFCLLGVILNFLSTFSVHHLHNLAYLFKVLGFI